MKAYYKIADGSEADKLLAAYFAECDANADKLIEFCKKNNFDPAKIASNDRGEPAGFKPLSGEIHPDWIYLRSYPSYAYPRRKKATAELRKEIGSYAVRSRSGICKALFGKKPLIFIGLRMIDGVGYREEAGRKLIEFWNEDHVERFVENSDLKWPKGLRRIKASTVTKWQEENPSRKGIEE